jgi:hypothetical protein
MCSRVSVYIAAVTIIGVNVRRKGKLTHTSPSGIKGEGCVKVKPQKEFTLNVPA